MTTIKRTTKQVANIGLILMLGLILIPVANPAWAGEEQQLVDKAEMTLKNLHKENAWFRDHGKEAKAILAGETHGPNWGSHRAHRAA